MREFLKYLLKRKHLFLNVFCLFVAIIFSVISSAEAIEEDYGSDLKSVPFYVKNAYLETNGKYWDDTTFDEREAYLKKLDRDSYRDEKIKQQRNLEVERLEQSKKRERLAEKRFEANKESQKVRLKLAEERAKDIKSRQLKRAQELQRKKINDARKRQIRRN